MTPDIRELLIQMVKKNASDLHIGAKFPICYRVDGKLVPADTNILSPEEVKDITYSLLSKEQIQRFETDWELDLSFGIENVSRYRVNVFKQRGSIGCTIRLIPFDIMTFSQCGLPIDVVTDLCRKNKGLVLVTGATGSGKSTTLASMIDYINSNRSSHIVTVEDPIEFIHKNKKSIVDQRELFADTKSFPAALKHVLRQDPDVILIGEMRDLETIESALVIAETGHLVLATLHTSDAIQTINRVVDVFPSHQQQQIKMQLSFVLLGIVSQQLLAKQRGGGRVLAAEILLANSAIRSLAREGKVHQIYSVVQTCQKEGMKTMNQSLCELYTKGLISYEDTISHSTMPDEIDKLIGTIR